MKVRAWLLARDRPHFTLAGYANWASESTAVIGGYINKSAVIGTLSQLGMLGRVIQASQAVTVVGAVSANVGTHLGVGIVYHYFCRVHGWICAEGEVS